MRQPGTNFWPPLLRIAVGAWWLLAAAAKITNPFYASVLLTPTLARWANAGQHGAIGGFITSTLIPNTGVLAFAIKALELAIGVALVLGVATRVAALGGFLVVAAAWVLQEGFRTFSGYGEATFLVMITMAYLVLASSGHLLAIDALRARRPVVPQAADVVIPVATPVRPRSGSMP